MDETLIKESINWARSKEKCVSRSLPWRKGILLYGKPGTGKTSLARRIAGSLGSDLVFCPLHEAAIQKLSQCGDRNLAYGKSSEGDAWTIDYEKVVVEFPACSTFSSSEWGDDIILPMVDRLDEFVISTREWEERHEVPSHSVRVVLLDDVDHQLLADKQVGMGGRTGKEKTKIELLLALLDGEYTLDGNLVIITVNDLSVLEEYSESGYAVLRPGRIDIKKEVLPSDSCVVEGILTNCFETYTHAQLVELTKLTEGWTPAKIVTTLGYADTVDEVLTKLRVSTG